jgi:hypothetical protein
MPGEVQVPQGAKFDPNTGVPVASMSGMDAYNQAAHAFAAKAGELSIEIAGDPNGPDWSVTIKPQGKMSPRGR